jgi:hypothetical protein
VPDREELLAGVVNFWAAISIAAPVIRLGLNQNNAGNIAGTDFGTFFGTFCSQFGIFVLFTPKITI